MLPIRYKNQRNFEENERKIQLVLSNLKNKKIHSV